MKLWVKVQNRRIALYCQFGLDPSRSKVYSKLRALQGSGALQHDSLVMKKMREALTCEMSLFWSVFFLPANLMVNWAATKPSARMANNRMYSTFQQFFNFSALKYAKALSHLNTGGIVTRTSAAQTSYARNHNSKRDSRFSSLFVSAVCIFLIHFVHICNQIKCLQQSFCISFFNVLYVILHPFVVVYYNSAVFDQFW